MIALSYRLNKLCTLQSPTPGQADDGGPLLTWDDVASVWADIRHLSGIESIKGGAVTATAKASIRIRYRTGINSGWRILHNSTAYNITSALPDMTGKRYVDLICEVVT